MSVVLDRCPLCGGRSFAEDSVAESNLYSEKLAALLGENEQRLLDEYSNWRCHTCGLIFKRRWFAESVIRELFNDAVATHPKGWDAVSDRFSAAGFNHAMARWAAGCADESTADRRRGERELLSILDSITEPAGYSPAAAITSIKAGDVTALRAWSRAIVASIGEPAPFKRFAGFRSRALWDYLQDRTGGFDAYAEIGCPLWGLLGLAAESGVAATLLQRGEPNYWGRGCQTNGETCTAALLRDRRIAATGFDGPRRHRLVGLFQYLDHVAEPRKFLESLFGKADSLAVILDDVDAPVAIQHVSGWTDSALIFVAEMFGRRLHTDFNEIRPSGNVLYLLAGSRCA